jgi:hypothetical protein
MIDSESHREVWRLCIPVYMSSRHISNVLRHWFRGSGEHFPNCIQSTNNVIPLERFVLNNRNVEIVTLSAMSGCHASV